MKKTHLILLAVTAVLALSSAYSLAAINQVYSMDFEWYSQVHSRYESAFRDVSGDRCLLPARKLDLEAYLINTPDSLQALNDTWIATGAIQPESLDDYIYIYFILGDTGSPEYRIKLESIAQRGSNVEVKVSLNTPERMEKTPGDEFKSYCPTDLIRIKKASFPSKGRLYFLFKNQNGGQLLGRYCVIR